jgi:hypothetical protein
MHKNLALYTVNALSSHLRRQEKEQAALATFAAAESTTVAQLTADAPVALAALRSIFGNSTPDADSDADGRERWIVKTKAEYVLKLAVIKALELSSGAAPDLVAFPREVLVASNQALQDAVASQKKLKFEVAALSRKLQAVGVAVEGLDIDMLLADKVTIVCLIEDSVHTIDDLRVRATFARQPQGVGEGGNGAPIAVRKRYAGHLAAAVASYAVYSKFFVQHFLPAGTVVQSVSIQTVMTSESFIASHPLAAHIIEGPLPAGVRSVKSLWQAAFGPLRVARFTEQLAIHQCTLNATTRALAEKALAQVDEARQLVDQLAVFLADTTGSAPMVFHSARRTGEIPAALRVGPPLPRPDTYLHGQLSLSAAFSIAFSLLFAASATIGHLSQMSTVVRTSLMRRKLDARLRAVGAPSLLPEFLSEWDALSEPPSQALALVRGKLDGLLSLLRQERNDPVLHCAAVPHMPPINIVRIQSWNDVHDLCDETLRVGTPWPGGLTL